MTKDRDQYLGNPPPEGAEQMSLSDEHEGLIVFALGTLRFLVDSTDLVGEVWDVNDDEINNDLAGL